MADDVSPDKPLRGLLRPEEAAQFLAISTRQLRDLTRAGDIGYVNIGQRDRETRRYTMADLEAFIEARKNRCRSFPARKLKPLFQHLEVIDFTALNKERSKKPPTNRKSGKRPTKT